MAATTQGIREIGIQIKNEKRPEAVTNQIEGQQFIDIADVVDNAVTGTNLLGSRADISTIKSEIITPSKGDTYSADDTGHYWKYNDVISEANPYNPNKWVDIGIIIPGDILPGNEIRANFNSLFGTQNHFANLVLDNKFLADNGQVSMSSGFSGYLTGYIAVSLGEIIYFDLYFPYESQSTWGCIWGYSDLNGNNPIKLKVPGTFTDDALQIPTDGSVRYIRACSQSGSIIPSLVGTANISKVTSKLFTDILFPKKERNLFIASTGGLSSSTTYNGYLTNPLPVKKGEKYLIRGYFPFLWSNIWGYPTSTISTTGAVAIGHISVLNKSLIIEIPDNVNYLRVCAMHTSKEVPCVVKIDDNISLDLLNQKIVDLETKYFALGDIKNGVPVIYGDITNTSLNNTGGTASISRDLENNIITFTKSGTDNNWLTTPKFYPTGASLVYIDFELELTGTSTEGVNVILVGDINNPAKWKILRNIKENGSYSIYFDPAYYQVYEGFTEFTVWLANATMTTGQNITAKYTNFRVSEFTSSVKGANIIGSDAKELFESTDRVLSEIKSSIQGNIELISPLGKRFVLSVQDDGTVYGVAVTPNISKFFGNSLLNSWGYGMAASEEGKAYYYLITEYINSLNPSHISSRYQGQIFEGLTDSSLIDSTIQSVFLDNLVGNEDLVVLQLGDNVNTPEKEAVFPESSLKLCQAVRAKCPNARVVWMGMWYGNANKYTAIQDACIATGCQFVNFSGIRSLDTENRIGNLTKIGNDTRTLSGVTNVLSNTSTNITVTFTVSSTSYNSTLDVSSYSLSGTTLTYTSEYEIISSAGVASHPNDEGFRLIANKVLYETKMTDDIEQIKKIV